MTLEQLRIFIAVAERQHVTQAASQLNLTQSATSAAIAALETRYGIKLFDRIGRGIVLTQAGREFLGEARGVVARAKAAAQVLNDLAGLKRGLLNVAASQTVANYWLPPRIEAFRNLAQRTGVDDLRTLVTMLTQTDRFGTSIGQALRTHAETSRTKRRQRAEERAAKVGVKLVFPLALCLFPALYVVCFGPVMVRIYRTFV